MHIVYQLINLKVSHGIVYLNTAKCYVAGQEINVCLLDLRTPPCAHRHLDVVLSTIRRYNDIAIYTKEENVEHGLITTENIVFPE